MLREANLNAVVEGMGSGGRALGFESQHCHSLPVCLKEATDIVGSPFLSSLILSHSPSSSGLVHFGFHWTA